MEQRSLNILIVEDSYDDYELYMRFLTNIFLKPIIDHCAKASSAKSIIEKNHYDLILLDYNLPGSNGLELLRSLDSLKLGAAIVALTGQGNESVAVEFMKLGVCDYLQKDKMSKESLSYAINRALELSYSRRIEYEKQIELTRFAHTITHDLKAPLGRIKTYADLIVNTKAIDNFEYIQNIADDAAYVSNFLDKLLEFAEFGRVNISKIQVDLNILVKKAIDNLEMEIQESKATIKIDSLPEIYGHETSLIQLFQNIISNSIKYSEKEPEIVIQYSNSSEDSIISIIDNGIGVDEQYLESVFEPFQKLSNKQSKPGVGLGLALCKAIVEEHNGSIKMENLPKDQGSKVIISFPKLF